MGEMFFNRYIFFSDWINICLPVGLTSEKYKMRDLIKNLCSVN